MNSKLLGGVLLIIGMTIGAGMLALPIALAEMGFFQSTLLLLVGWVVMTSSALLLLEINLWLPPESNLISMAKATLGPWGQAISWLVYLLLLYSLLAAFTAGGGDLINNIFTKVGLKLPQSISSLIFAGILGVIVYRGIGFVDYVNRGLMFSKLGIYIVLVFIILLFISPTNLAIEKIHYTIAGFAVILTAFGFAQIIPSLRVYFNNDVAKLRLAIILGSLIPLICYILWDLAIMGVIPRSGDQSLTAILQSGRSTSGLIDTLNQLTHHSIVSSLTSLFTAICLATSFLGVALSLSDFLADGFHVNKRGKGNLLVYSTTFVPPLLVVIIDPNIFIKALSYAGIYCVILLIILPVLMTWRGRYYKKYPSVYQVSGGKKLLIGLLIVSAIIIFEGIWQNIK